MIDQDAIETIQAIRAVGIKLRSNKEYRRQFFKDAGIVFLPKKKKKSGKTQKKKPCPIISLSR